MVGRGLRAHEGKTDLLLLDHAGCVPVHGLPGEDVEWELTDDEGAAKRLSLKQPVPCPECRAILSSNGHCGVCGWKPAPPPAETMSEPGAHVADRHDEAVNLIRLSDAAQARVKAVRSDPRRKEYHRLIAIAAKRGMKYGWIAYRFKEAFGEWPNPLWALPNPEEVQPSVFLHAAEKFAKARGWKKGWAPVQFKQVYGRWPPRVPAP